MDEHNVQVRICSVADSSVENNLTISSTGSELSELAIHTLLVETRPRDLDREAYHDPDSDRYLERIERVFENAAEGLETIAVSKN